MKKMMKYGWLLALVFPVALQAQDAAYLLDSAKKLEAKFKEEQAFEWYKQANNAASTVAINTKLAELSTNIAGRKTDPLQKMEWLRQALTYSKTARDQDSANADANYITALVYDRLSEADDKKENIAEDIRFTKSFIDKAIALNPNNGRYYHVLGRWHLNLLNINPIKKTAVKLLYGLPQANIDTAIAYMEKCKAMEPYYCPNFYDLGRAYNFNRNYEKAMAVLQQLAKLPTRRQDDPEVKKQGAALLQELN